MAVAGNRVTHGRFEHFFFRSFEAERAATLLRAGDVLRARIGGRLGRAVGLFARGGLAALDTLEAARWDVFTQRPKPSRARLAREAALVLMSGRRLDGARPAGVGSTEPAKSAGAGSAGAGAGERAEAPASPAPERES